MTTNAETTPVADALPVRRRGRPRLADGTQKVQISIRLDPDVAEFFTSSGGGWSVQIGDILKAHVKRQQRRQQRRRRTRKGGGR